MCFRSATAAELMSSACAASSRGEKLSLRAPISSVRSSGLRSHPSELAADGGSVWLGDNPEVQAAHAGAV